MKENPQKESGGKTISNEDEIMLIDFLRVIWNRKYLILTGTMICALIAVIISLIQPKVYIVETVLQPGVLSIKEDGSNNYIDSAENIKAIIEAGTFNNLVLGNIDPLRDDLPQSLKFTITIPEPSNTLKITYETSNKDQGVSILSKMCKILLEKYSKIVEYYQKDFGIKIDSKKAEMTEIKALIKNYGNNIQNIEKRINELKPAIEIISNDTQNLIKARDKFLDIDANERGVLSALLYSNTIQQNLKLAEIYKDEIIENKLKKENELIKSEESKSKLSIISHEIDNLELKKSNVQNIQILQSPTINPLPVKPNTKLNVVLASASGLFLTVFLAFFLEYIRMDKDRKQ